RATGEELRPDGDGFGTVVGLFPAAGGLLAVGPRPVARWRLGERLPAVVARSPDPVAAAAAAGEMLVTAGPGRASVWENLPADGFAVRPARAVELTGGAVTAAAVAPDRTRAAVATDDKRVLVFDPRDGTPVRAWAAPGVARALA